MYHGNFFTSSHFISQFPPTRFPLITAIRTCRLLPVHHLGMAFLAGSKVKIQYYPFESHLWVTLTEGFRIYRLTSLQRDNISLKVCPVYVTWMRCVYKMFETVLAFITFQRVFRCSWHFFWRCAVIFQFFFHCLVVYQSLGTDNAARSSPLTAIMLWLFQHLTIVLRLFHLANIDSDNFKLGRKLIMKWKWIVNQYFKYARKLFGACSISQL